MFKFFKKKPEKVWTDPDLYTDPYGGVPNLMAARVAFQHIIEYTELRWRNGDIFLDGHDDADIAVEAIKLLDKLDEDYFTGKEQTEEVMDKVWGPDRFKGRDGDGQRLLD